MLIKQIRVFSKDNKINLLGLNSIKVGRDSMIEGKCDQLRTPDLQNRSNGAQTQAARRRVD